MPDVLRSHEVFESWWQEVCVPAFTREPASKQEKFKMLCFVAWKTAVESEREMCARVCDMVAQDSLDLGVRVTARALASVIRSRETTEEKNGNP